MINKIYTKLEELCRDYHEGTEVSDALDALRSAAATLYGLGCTDDAAQIILIVYSLIREDLASRITYEGIESLTPKEQELWAAPLVRLFELFICL